MNLECVFLLILPALAAEDRALEYYLQEITDHNPACQAAHQRWQAAREAAKIAALMPEPNLKLGIYVQEVETRVGPQKQRLGVSQLIPWKGKRALKGQRAREEAQQARAVLTAIQLKLTTRFKTLYAEYYYIGKSIAVTGEHLELLKNLEAVVTERYQTSAAHYNDLIRIQIEIDALSDRLNTQRASAHPVSAAMKALLGREVSGKLPFPRVLPVHEIPADLSKLALTLEKHNPLLQAMDHEIASHQVSLALAKKNIYPDFQVGLDWINTGTSILAGTPESGKDAFILNVGVQLPIKPKKYRAMDRMAANRLEASAQQRVDTRRHLEVGLKRAVFQLDDASRKIVLYRDQIIPKAEESLNVMMSGFQTGDVTYLDLIEAEKALLEFMLSLNQAEANRLEAITAMEAVLGEPPFPLAAKE